MAKKPKAQISKEVREAVLRRDGYRCRYCGSETGPFHMDHVYPESKGGETSIENLVTSCESCNRSKYDKVGIWPRPNDYFGIPFEHTPTHRTIIPESDPPKVDWYIPILWMGLFASAIGSGLVAIQRPGWQSALGFAICQISLIAATFYLRSYAQDYKKRYEQWKKGNGE